MFDILDKLSPAETISAYFSLVALIIAIIGAALGIINFLELKGRAKRRLKVKLEYAIPHYPNGQLGDQFIKIVVTNSGHRDVTVTNIGIELPEKRTLAWMQKDIFPIENDSTIPATISDGEAVFRYFPLIGVQLALKNAEVLESETVRVYADDSVGKRHYGQSKPAKSFH